MESIELERMDEDIVCMVVVIESGKVSLKKKVKEEMRKVEEERRRMKSMQELEEKKERVRLMCKRKEDVDSERILMEDYLNNYYTEKRAKEDQSFIQFMESYELVSIYLSHIAEHYQTISNINKIVHINNVLIFLL